MHDSPGRRGAVAVISRDGKLLVIRRSKLVVAPGAYCFPGGGLEESESEEQALVRELHEELGVRVEPLCRIWESVTPWSVALAWWSAELDPSSVLMPNPAEVESVHWCSLAEMARLPSLLESNQQFLSAVERGEVALRLDAPTGSSRFGS
jgi:8-oxo-dGTP pyrophosphatase MutT (NUDIX family)